MHLLLDAGANVAAGTYDPNPLTYAARAGHREAALLLLNAGAPANVRSTSDESPFAAAVFAGHFDLADDLIARGADERVHLISVIHSEAWREKLEFLDRHGVDFDAEPSYPNGTPLEWAVVGGREDVVQYLLNRGCRRDRRNRQGKTPAELLDQRIDTLKKQREEAKTTTPSPFRAPPRVPTDGEWQLQMAPYYRIRNLLE
jgi:ankyrin repeat protein